MRSTNNPTKLAYIRWPVQWLFNFIKPRYLKIPYKGGLTLYGTLQLKVEERRRLFPGKYINIIQFIHTTLRPPKI